MEKPNIRQFRLCCAVKALKKIATGKNAKKFKFSDTILRAGALFSRDFSWEAATRRPSPVLLTSFYSADSRPHGRHRSVSLMAALRNIRSDRECGTAPVHTCKH